MNRAQHNVNNEGGFVLVVALMILVILSLIGIAGLNTSIFEKQIAGNDWNAQRTFYRADGGASLGSEVIEQSYACISGFNGGVGPSKILQLISDTSPLGKAIVMERKDNEKDNDMKLWANSSLSADEIATKLDNPLVSYDVGFPLDANGNLPSVDVGYLYFTSRGASMMPGGSIQMASGYEGKGKSAAQGGVAKFTDIYSQFLGPKHSESIVMAGWRHAIGTEGDTCKY